jgi:hypothetical protein
MKANSPPKKSLPLNRKTLTTLAILVVAVGGLWALWRHMTNPPRPWLVRWQVMRYLKKNSTIGNFKVDFPFPSKAEMAKAPKKDKTSAPTTGKRTGKDFDSLAREYIELKTTVLRLEEAIPAAETEIKTLKPQFEKLTNQVASAKTDNATNRAVLRARANAAEKRLASLEKTIASRPELDAKQTALVPIVSDLWDFQRVWAAEMEASAPSGDNPLTAARAKLSADARQRMSEAQSYGTIYKAIGQQLWVGERLLASANPDHKRVGVSLALEASRNALNQAENGWVAASIVRGYVWPNLELADDSNRRSPFNLDNLLEQCADILRRADDTAGLVGNYQKMLALAQTPQGKDQARAQIAMAYQQAGNLEQAISYLRQIKLTNDFRWAVGRIPWLERQLKASQ